ncbi:amidohydrolase family protein [Roseomonas sp. BN140053]|uniref:amidohydrolase family protein n=1 Tax=Roseomonas sp. BN140053 TaxID=3391898 RepID=UPI0039EB5522
MLSCENAARPTHLGCGCRPTRRGLLGAAMLGGALAAWRPAQAQAPAAAPGTGQPARNLARTNAARIDVHHHVAPPAYLAAARASNAPRNPVGDSWTLEGSLEQMERSGITTAVLSLTNPGLAVAGNRAEDLGRACNEYVAGLVRDHPGKFGNFASLPLPDIDASLRVLAHAFDELKADGVQLFTNYDGKWLGDPYFAPLFDELNRRRAVVYTHPVSAACCVNLVPGITDSAIEWGTDTTRTIASLTFAGAATRWPNIEFIFSHAGGTMPFLIERFDTLAAGPGMAAKLPPGGVRAALAHWNYDTAQVGNAGSLGALLRIVPPTQLLLGSDYPFRLPVDQVGNLLGVQLDPAVMRAVEMENPRRLIPRLRA